MYHHVAVAYQQVSPTIHNVGSFKAYGSQNSEPLKDVDNLISRPHGYASLPGKGKEIRLQMELMLIIR